MGPNDPFFQPGAILTDRKRMFEVIDVKDVPTRKVVILEDFCGEGKREEIDTWRVKIWPWRLVRPAPAAPDHVPESVEAV